MGCTVCTVCTVHLIIILSGSVASCLCLFYADARTFR